MEGEDILRAKRLSALQVGLCCSMELKNARCQFWEFCMLLVLLFDVVSCILGISSIW
jgi:hypothetical protein